jgi:hypothetical protein
MKMTPQYKSDTVAFKANYIFVIVVVEYFSS